MNGSWFDDKEEAGWSGEADEVAVRGGMLCVAMRREADEPQDGTGAGAVRPRQPGPRAPAQPGDEFVDISQVQQLLIDGQAVMGMLPPPPPPVVMAPPSRRPPPYYNPCTSQQQQQQQHASVEDLVAMWFATTPSVQGKF